MSAKTIRNALGILQDEPDNEQAWSDLRESLGFTSEEGIVDPGELAHDELAELLEAARKAHEMRREYEAVGELLEIEAALATGEREAELVAELAQVRDEELLDDASALAAYRRLLTLKPGDQEAEEAIERSEAKKAKWKDLAQKYFVESKGAGDAAFKSSLLVSAAEIAYRYGRPELEAKARAAKEAKEGTEPGPASKKGKAKGKSKGKVKAAAEEPKKDEHDEKRQALLTKILGLLADALKLDPKNRRAASLQERILREEERWEELATALDAFATEVPVRDEKLAALVRLARVSKKKLEDLPRAMAAYERVIDIAPGHGEATRALVDHFTEKEMWDHLLALYEGQLSGGGVRPGQEVGVIFQLAMVNWKMKDKPEAAEPYFERLRKFEPAHSGMLGFFRDWCRTRGEQPRLVQILTDAQRALPDGPERAKLGAEIAQFAEEGANAQKAVEQWRNVLRSDPKNEAARDALKRLYRQTGAFNHLADLLRSELERTASDDKHARLPVLREIAKIYRESIKSDSALVTVLSQIIALDPTDADAIRELARVYEALGRWRDLLTAQMRLAELEQDGPVKAEHYRSIARRWMDQFSNVQNAVEAYEKLLEAAPTDREAASKLRDLYTKRRAYRPLYDLLEREAQRSEGAERRAIWVEMARIASDRLDRGADAARIYKQIISEDPQDASALDALEKQAERDKDFATVAEVLEKRVDLTQDSTQKLGVLQKLGSVYSDRLQDHKGALRVWRRVLELAPGHVKALRILRESYLAIGDFDGLAELYASQNDFEGLVEVLGATADRSTDNDAKVALSFRCAEIFEEKLGAPERAFRAYERVLSVRPDDLRAASALVPIYEREEKWARLPALYEVQLAHASSPEEKRAIFKKLSIVTGVRLADRAAAFSYARKAFELAPEDPAALRDLEQWASRSGEWGGLAEAIQARLAKKDVAADEGRRLRMKLAEVAASHAGRSDDAIRAYRELIETNEEDEDAIAGLDRLLRAAPDRRDDLRWLFRLRVTRAGGLDKVPLLAEWALLEEEAFGSAEEAIDLHREVLELDSSQMASLRALSRLLLDAGQAEEAAKVLQRERDLETGGSRVAREIDLARLYLGQLKNPRDALAAAKRALEEAPHDAHAIAIVEELLPMAETRATAARVLEEAYMASGQWVKQGEVLAVLIATAPSKQDRLELHRRLAQVRAKLGDLEGAFETMLKAALDYPSDLTIWDELAVLANRTQRTQEFVDAIATAVPERGESGLPLDVEMDLAERAATLYDEMIGDIDRATPYLERILAKDAGNERAFVRLKQILTTREKWSELDKLYERMIAATQDDARRADLLNEVALVAEEITGDANKAIHYYERIVEPESETVGVGVLDARRLEPGHQQAILALDKLYQSQERWQELANLLQRRIDLAGAADTTALELRLGTILFVRLGNPKGALDALERVVTADSSIREARELVEKCLTHPDLRQRAAIILEGVYAEREEMRDLVRVLEVRLEFVGDDVERRDLLRRIAELRDERLTDDRGAFETYGRLLPLAPGDVEARTRYLEIGRRLDRLSEAGDVLMMSAKNADSPQPRAEILGDVAKIYEETEETERAELVHRQILELAPEDSSIAGPACLALERLYIARGKHAELAKVLETRVKLEDDGEVRRELFARLGRLYENEVRDDAAAIAAWKARLEDDPGDAEALASLDRLYERAGDHRALVEVLRAREKNADGSESRKAVMVRSAETLEKLGDVDEAILGYRAILDDFGADRAVLDRLGRLYEKAERWRDLSETLEEELALANEAGERVALLTRIGDVRRDKLGEIVDAIESYRQALETDVDAPGARQALERLLEEDTVKNDVAGILRPLYESEQGAESKLVRVLEIQIENEASLDARLELLAQASSVTERALGDRAKAFAFTARALKESAAEPMMPEWVARAERLTEDSGQWADLVQLYRDALPDVLDEEQQLALTLRIADLARTRLADATLAKEHYKKALDLRADDARPLVALESLYEESGEHEALLEILARRADGAATDEEKKNILFKLARVCSDKLQDRDRSISMYEQILDLGLERTAVDALERLYREADRWGDLVALHERELGAPQTSGQRRASLHHALGRIYQLDLAEIDRAFDEYAEALNVDPAHDATIRALEELMTRRSRESSSNVEDAAPVSERGLGNAARAAAMLEDVYLARLDWRKVMMTVEARLDASQDPEERRTLLKRLAKLHEEQEENYRAALDVTAKLLTEDVTDEATWAELERLARVANADDRLAEIYAGELDKISADEPATARLAFRTGALLEKQGNRDRALVYYRRAYQFAPEEEQAAFRAIDRLLTGKDRAAERVALYRDALEYRTEPAQRIATLHTIAQIEENDLEDPDAAIVTYRSILDTEETDVRALDALTGLFTRREKHRDLAELHRRRAETSALPEDEARWRLEYARVLDKHLDDTSAALDEVQTVLGLVAPQTSETGRAAVAFLESALGKVDVKARVVEMLRPLFETEGDWRRLVELAKHRYQIAATPQEKVAVLRDTAQLLESRGNDLQQAFACLKEAFVLDPDDGDTREELDRLAVAIERWDDLAEAYEQGIAKTDDVGQKELLRSLAQLHDKRRDDPRKALAAWERLFALDESDLGPLDEMDQLATLLSDWPALVRVLAKRAELTNDDEERASLWRRIGEARRDMLDDAQGAIEAYERALELEPESAWTIDNLIMLYEGRNDAARLVALYKKRVDLCTEDDLELKHRLLLDAARMHEIGLNDRREAVNLLVQALETKPDDAEVVQRLATLYEAEKMWPELLDNLRAQAAKEGDAAARAGLTKRIADILASELDDHAGALEAYREVLAHGYDAGAAAAVRKIGDARDELRRDAADILEPVLRAAQKWDDVVDVLEMGLRAETDASERAATLRAIAKVCEEALSDLARAEQSLLRAIGERPDDAELHAEIERIADFLGRGGWQGYADALSERAASIFEAKVTADLFFRLGTIAEHRLSDLPRAAEAYARAAEQGGDSAEVLGALERVYGALNDTRALVDVIERRIAIETDLAAQADLLHRLASLQIGALGDKSQGLATLRQALERSAEHAASRAAVEELLSDDALFDDAFDTLEGVYRSTNAGADLARIYARRIDRAETPKDRTRARLELAKVLENEGGNPTSAQRAVETAVEEDPLDQDALSELDRLAEQNGAWREAAGALARALETQDKGRIGSTARMPTMGSLAELWARLGRMRRDRVGDPTGAENAFALAVDLDPENVELVRSLEELRRAPGRERDRIVSLRKLARLEHEPDKKRELAREAATLAEQVVGDADLAEQVLRELLAELDGDAWAAEELTRLREAAGDHEEVLRLLLERAVAEGDGEQALALRHRAAEIAADRLGDKERASRLYEQIFEQERGDRRAQERLHTLYAELDKNDALAKLLRTLIDMAETPEERTALRLDLARVQLEKFDAPQDASDTLRAVLEEEPDNDDAATVLGDVYERTGRNAELAELQQNLVERARARGDANLELDRMVRLGEILEERVQDTGAALSTYEEVLQRSPSHRGALEAVARLSEGREQWEKASAALATLLETASGGEAVDLALRLASARGGLKDDEGVERALERALAADERNAGVRERLAALYERTKKWDALSALLVGNADIIRNENPPYEPPPVIMQPVMNVRGGSIAPGPRGGSIAPPAANVPAYVAEEVKLLRRVADIHLKERRSPTEAVPVLERVAKLVPQDREVLLTLCDAYTSAKREREAAAVLEKIIASFGNKRTKELSLYHHRLGRALASLGDKDVALAQFDMAFKIDPGSIEVLRDLGVLALDANDLDRAQKTFRALLLQRLDASSGISKGEVFYYLGEISMKQGDKAKAVQMLERAIENEPGLDRAKQMLSGLKG